MNDSSCVFEIIYSTMQQSHNTMSVKTLCEMASVSRSGYYAWVKAVSARELREQQDRDDFSLILTAYKMHGYTKGARGIYMAMLHMDPPVIMNLKKIRRLMDKFNLSCPYRGPNPYRRMAKALKTSNVADNLLQREFEAYDPRIALLTDITYLPYNALLIYLLSWMPLPSRYCRTCSVHHWKWISFWKPSTNWWKITESPSKRKRSFIQIRDVTIPAISS